MLYLRAIYHRNNTNVFECFDDSFKLYELSLEQLYYSNVFKLDINWIKPTMSGGEWDVNHDDSINHIKVIPYMREEWLFRDFLAIKGYAQVHNLKSTKLALSGKRHSLLQEFNGDSFRYKSVDQFIQPKFIFTDGVKCSFDVRLKLSAKQFDLKFENIHAYSLTPSEPADIKESGVYFLKDDWYYIQEFVIKSGVFNKIKLYNILKADFRF
jgi:hypothetical protein